MIFIILISLTEANQPKIWPDFDLEGEYEYFATITDEKEKTRRFVHEIHRKDGFRTIENRLNGVNIKAFYGTVDIFSIYPSNKHKILTVI